MHAIRHAKCGSEPARHVDEAPARWLPPESTQSQSSGFRRRHLGSLSATTCAADDRLHLVVDGIGSFTDDILIANQSVSEQLKSQANAISDQAKVLTAQAKTISARQDDIRALQQTICSMVDFLQSYQELETAGATDWEYFAIEGSHFLACANHDRGPSVIYQMDDDTGLFEAVQEIETSFALDLEYFSIGGSHYLAVANYQNLTSFEVVSVIYRMDNKTGLFEVAQEISTFGAASWKYFWVRGSHFLAVANSQNDVTVEVPSVIYKLNNITGLFDTAQEIDTSEARDLEYFAINGTHFVAVANADTAPDTKSVIYKLHNGTGFFEVTQQIETSGAVDWEYFDADGSHFLAVANYNSPVSVIYKLDNTTGLFELAQEIDTLGAVDWEHFVIDRSHFLAVSNYYNGTSRHVVSAIYILDTATKLFRVVQEVDTFGAHGWEHFTVDGSHFLAVANARTDTTPAESVVYSINVACAHWP